MSLEIVERIKESDSLELALENALNKLQKGVKKRNDDLHLLNVVTVDEQNRPCLLYTSPSPRDRG